MASIQEIELKKFGNKIFYSVKRIIVLFLLFIASANPQMNIEAIANLHFKINSNKSNWLEGYNSIQSGSYSPYQSHRSRVNRDSAFVVRTSGDESMIEWRTSDISKSFSADSVSFIWACGFGNNLGNEWYDLSVDDEKVVSFSTINDTYWSVTGANDIHLSFTAVFQNYNGANFGYMVLTIPRTFIGDKQGLNLKLQGRVAEKETWYRLFVYKDVIQEIINRAHQNHFSNLEFINMGDAVFTICLPREYSNSKVELFNADVNIAKDNLVSDGILSKTKITIPRFIQPDSNINTIVKINGNSIDTIYWYDINKKRIRSFMEEELEADRYVFPIGDFPSFHWKNEIMVENEIGKFPLEVSYYNKNFQQVTTADKPGRYGAVIKGIIPSGFIIKRYVTLFCSDAEFDDYSKNVPITINKLKDYEIDDQKWEKYLNNEERYSFGSLKYFPQHDPDAAVFLAGLNDLDSINISFNTPRIKDRQWWLKCKEILDGDINHKKPLILPKTLVNDSSVLLSDKVSSTIQYDKGKIDKIRKTCQQWAEYSGVPNVTLIVHNGKIIFYEAFGKDDSGKEINKDSNFWMASITKLLTGVLMMQFVDQGLIDIDAPVGNYLPELNGVSNNILTLRHLFTHTSGLQFAGEWASDWNYSLDNQIAQVLPIVNIGETFAYHRVGYALSGKVMEQLTGYTIPELFYNYIFKPLGMKSAYADNTYGGLYCSSIDLARLGQMLLNKGTYNGYRFFSERAFEEMLPKRLAISDRSWGIGTSSMAGHGLSELAFGHGAASGSVFRIDPKNNLIIISARNKPGKSFEKFENELIENCSALLNNN